MKRFLWFLTVCLLFAACCAAESDFDFPVYRLSEKGEAIKVANQQSVCVEDLAERGVAYR